VLGRPAAAAYSGDMQSHQERVLDAAKRLPATLPLDEFVERLAFLVRVRKEMEELVARADEPSRDVQTGATVARGCLTSIDGLSERTPVDVFRDRMALLDQLSRSAQDIAAGRTIPNEEVFKRLTWRRKAAARSKKPVRKRSKSRNK